MVAVLKGPRSRSKERGATDSFLLIFLGVENQENAKKSKKRWEISGKMRNLPKFF